MFIGSAGLYSRDSASVELIQNCWFRHQSLRIQSTKVLLPISEEEENSRRSRSRQPSSSSSRPEREAQPAPAAAAPQPEAAKSQEELAEDERKKIFAALDH